VGCCSIRFAIRVLVAIRELTPIFSLMHGSEPLWSMQHGSCLLSGGSEEDCARELQVAYLSALAAMRKVRLEPSKPL
jgi:hypothetical protein